MSWQFIGPRRFRTGQGYVSGRVNAIAIDPNNRAIIFAGAAGGGLWKTTDRGGDWTPLSDAWPYEEIASVAIDPGNPSVIYVGTGDFQGWGVRGFGLMKSENGGATWMNLPEGEEADTSISGIVVDPNNSQNVIICGGRGRNAYGYIWRSTNGGLRFSRALNVPGAWSKITIGQDDGGGERAIYAVGWNWETTGYLVYRSLDRGKNWEQLDPPLGQKEGVVSVATSPIEAKRVYVMTAGSRKVFSSSDYGDNWEDVTDDLRQDDFEWQQQGYDWALECGSSSGGSPHDVLLLGLLHLNYWDSGLRAWTLPPHGHDDVHAVVRDPTDSNSFLIGNDGGVFELSRIGVKPEWSLSSLNATLGITQCYDGMASPHSVSIFLAATQDNAIASSQTDLDAWDTVFPPAGGDAIHTMVSPANPRVQFVEGGVRFYGIGRTEDQWQSSKNITPDPLMGDNIDPFSTPIEMDSGGSRLYWATDYLWIRDEGTGKWSGHVGGQQLCAMGFAVRVICIAPSDRDRVYTGSTDGQVWMGEGPNWRWTRIDKGLPNRMVSGITVHSTNPNDIIVVVSGTGSGHVWHCDNTKAQNRAWEDVSGSGMNALPDIPAVAIRRDPRDPSNLLYVGTDVGVFFSPDAGRNWLDYTVPKGLPTAQLSDLRLVGRSLYAILFGRGIWRLRLPMTVTTPSSASVSSTIFCASTSIDGRILLCQAKYGQAFSDWHQVAGNGRTDAAVACASVESTLFIFCKGLDGRIYVNQAEMTANNTDPEEFAQSFSGWFEVQGDGRTDVAPAATRIENSVFVFVKGLDGRIYLNQAEYRHAFSGWFEVQGDGRTDAAPTCATVGKSVFVFVKGLDQRIYVNQAEFGRAFSGWFEVQGDGRTDAAPATAAIDQSIFVVIKALNGGVFLNQAEFGHAFSGWFEVQGGGQTNLAPGASSVLQSLFVFILGVNGRLQVNQAWYRHAFSGWFLMGDEAP